MKKLLGFLTACYNGILVQPSTHLSGLGFFMTPLLNCRLGREAYGDITPRSSKGAEWGVFIANRSPTQKLRWTHEYMPFENSYEQILARGGEKK